MDWQNLQDGGIWLRYTTGINGVLFASNGTHMYWHLSFGGGFSPPQNMVAIASRGQSYRVRITVSGNEYKAFLNGSSTPITTLATSAFSSGTVGLYDNGAPRGLQTFDNVSVVPLLNRPTNLVSTSPTAGTVVLTWADNSLDETVFEIANDDSRWPVRQVGQNTTTATFVSLDPGTSYHWYVRACKAGVCSDWFGPVGKTPNGDDGAASANCPVAVTPSGAIYSSGGGRGQVTVSANRPGCNWTVTSNASWITLAGAFPANNPALMLYQVSANTTGSQRTGTLSVGTLAFTVTQMGASQCTFQVSPLSDTFPASGGTKSVSVTTQAGCSWSATGNSPWIRFVSGTPGVGTGTVQYTVAANGAVGRSGTFTVAGTLVSVAQAGDAAGAVDVTPDAIIQPGFRSQPWISAADYNWFEPVKITARNAIPGPIYLVLEGMPTQTALLCSNAYYSDLTTLYSLPAGNYLVPVSANSLSSGQIVTVPLCWGQATGTTPYKPHLLSGRPNR